MIADFMLANAAAIDGTIGRLTPLKEPLTVEAMAQIATEHGRLATLLQKVATDGKAPRSFAAKYLHFHCPVVPICDSYAAAGLVRLVRWDADEVPFAQPSEGDAEYWQFCVRFFRPHEACRQARVDVSAKSLDTYLWQVPGAI